MKVNSTWWVKNTIFQKFDFAELAIEPFGRYGQPDWARAGSPGEGAGREARSASRAGSPDLVPFLYLVQHVDAHVRGIRSAAAKNNFC
jgi:hypothetical protein